MLLSALFMSFFGSGGIHLCFGEDGHMAVELVDSCIVSGLGAKHTGMKSDACGHCVDVVFSIDAIHATDGPSHAQTNPLMFPAPLTPSLPPLQAYPGEPIHPSDCPHHKVLASLQSVVLLI